jgi:hypothetical protein
MIYPSCDPCVQAEFDTAKQNLKAKTITVTVHAVHMDQITKADIEIFKIKVELSDYIHKVYRKIEKKIGKIETMSDKIKDKKGKIKDKNVVREWHLRVHNKEGIGIQLLDYLTLADYGIKNKATICMVKDRVFGEKWVDVGNQVPQSLTEIKCPALATLLAKEAREGIVDLPESNRVLKLLDEATLTQYLWLDMGETEPKGRDLKNNKLSEALKLKKEFTSQELQMFGIFQDICMTNYVRSGSSYFQPAPFSQNHCIRATNGRYDDMIT